MDINKTLIRDLKSNDEKIVRCCFNSVYNNFYKLVYFCISQYVNNYEDIIELVNDTFIDFLNNIESLDENKNAKYYLLVIAKNNAISFLRKNNKYKIISDEILNTIPYEENYVSNDVIEKFKKVLSKVELDIIISHLLIGYTLKEISIKYKMPINTITSKYRRALKKANKFLKEDDFYE